MNLINENGSFNTLSIARRAQELWAQKQAFLGELDGDALDFWIGRIKTDVLESVWREVSREQASFFFEEVQPRYTPVEEALWTLLHEQQRSNPYYEHKKNQHYWHEKQKISETARHRTYDEYAAANNIRRDREHALKDIPALDLRAPITLIAAE